MPNDERTTVPPPAGGEDDAPPSLFKRLPPGATEEQRWSALEEMAVTYASHYVAAVQTYPQLVSKLDAILTAQKVERRDRLELHEKVDGMELGLGRVETDLRAVERRVDAVHGRVSALESSTVERVAALLSQPPIPPMRAELPSQHDFTDAKLETKEQAKQSLSESFARRASLTPGPAGVVSDTAENLTELASGVVESVVDERFDALEKKRAEKAEWTRLKAIEAAHEAALAEDARLKKEREDTAKNRAEEARKRRADSIASIIVALIIAALLGAFGLLWGKSIGHDAGVAEGRAASVPSLPVIVQTYGSAVVMSASASAAPAMPVSAPASVAPAAHH